MLPDKYECGTANGVGIAGLGAAVRWVLSRGVDCILEHETELKEQLVEGLLNIPGVTVYGPTKCIPATAVVSCRVKGKRVSNVGLELDDDYGILARVGLHCAPSAHRTIGTFPEGTVRLAPGLLTSKADIQAVLRAFEKVAVPHD